MDEEERFDQIAKARDDIKSAITFKEYPLMKKTLDIGLCDQYDVIYVSHLFPEEYQKEALRMIDQYEKEVLVRTLKDI